MCEHEPGRLQISKILRPMPQFIERGVIIHEDGSKEAVLIWDEGEFLLEVSSDSNVDLDVGVKGWICES